MKYLRVTIRWLDDRYHGLLDRVGPPEWPPAPYRLFQALLAGAARAGKLESLAGSLRWLETQPAPMIIAPPTKTGQVVTRFVPNNDGDKKPDRQDRLTGKTFRPTIMLDNPAVHYLWPLAGCGSEITDDIIAAVRCLTCLGWGIDLAYGDAQIVSDDAVANLGGIRWLPKIGVFRNEGMLRVPNEGSLEDLQNSHQSALGRIVHGQPLNNLKKPCVFDSVFYTSSERPLGMPAVFFELRDGDDNYFRFSPAKLKCVSAMVRHAAIKAMDVQKGFPPPGIIDPAEWVDTFVAGHRPDGVADHRQFSYVPLPSIGRTHSDANIRRVMIMAPFGEDAKLMHLAEQLNGCQLVREGGGAAPMLRRGRPDGVTALYTGQSRIWATVTPVILPGHDDHKPAKTRKLLLAAFSQSGIEQPCEFTWGALPYFPNCLSAYSHDRNGRPIGCLRPKKLEGLTAVHVRMRFDRPIAGPIVVGAGRHRGFGVFAGLKGEGEIVDKGRCATGAGNGYSARPAMATRRPGQRTMG